MREQEFYEVTEQHWKKEREKRKRCKLGNEWASSGEWGHCQSHSSPWRKWREGRGDRPCVRVHPEGAACGREAWVETCGEGHKSCP